VMIREKSHLLLEVFPFGRKFLLATVLQYLVLRQYFDRKKHFLFLVLPLPRQILESHGGSSGASNLSHRMISADDLQVIRRCHLFFGRRGIISLFLVDTLIFHQSVYFSLLFSLNIEETRIKYSYFPSELINPLGPNLYVLKARCYLSTASEYFGSPLQGFFFSLLQ